MEKVISYKNPIIPQRGICDPHIHVFEGKLWMYSSHDTSAENTTFDMRDWQIWSSPDAVEWTLEGVIRPEDTYLGASTDCWAVDLAERNGKYYFYFSNGSSATGVLVGESPAGPFADVLGRPLLDGTLTTTREYDPTVFRDDDGEYYIVFGGPKWCYGEGSGYYIARLGEDMISLAHPPRPIELDHMGDDKASLNKLNGRYYLSYGGFYAVSDCVYGPYRFMGHTGASLDHTSYCEWNGQLFNAITVYESTKYFRSSGLCYVHVRENGELCTDPLIVEYGVGRYDANWNRIEAEWYMRVLGAKKQENVGMPGFSVACEGEAALSYPRVKNLSGKKFVELFGAFFGTGGVIELREGTASGRLLGSLRVDQTISCAYTWNTRRQYKLSIDVPLSDEMDLCIVLKPDAGASALLDWFRIHA